MINPDTHQRKSKKKKQKDKTAAKNIDPYFGDLTCTKPVKPSKTDHNYQSTANQLFEMFPTANKEVVFDLLETHHGNFDLVLDQLLKRIDEIAFAPKENEPIVTGKDIMSEEKKEASLVEENNSPFKREDEAKESIEKSNKEELLLSEVNSTKEFEPSKENDGKEFQESTLEELKAEQDENTDEYKKDINEIALNSIADDLINKYPKYVLL